MTDSDEQLLQDLSTEVERLKRLKTKSLKAQQSAVRTTQITQEMATVKKELREEITAFKSLQSTAQNVAAETQQLLTDTTPVRDELYATRTADFNQRALLLSDEISKLSKNITAKSYSKSILEASASPKQLLRALAIACELAEISLSLSDLWPTAPRPQISAKPTEISESKSSVPKIETAEKRKSKRKNERRLGVAQPICDDYNSCVAAIGCGVRQCCAVLSEHLPKSVGSLRVALSECLSVVNWPQISGSDNYGLTRIADLTQYSQWAHIEHCAFDLLSIERHLRLLATVVKGVLLNAEAIVSQIAADKSALFGESSQLHLDAKNICDVPLATGMQALIQCLSDLNDSGLQLIATDAHVSYVIDAFLSPIRKRFEFLFSQNTATDKKQVKKEKTQQQSAKESTVAMAVAKNSQWHRVDHLEWAFDFCTQCIADNLSLFVDIIAPVFAECGGPPLLAADSDALALHCSDDLEADSAVYLRCLFVRSLVALCQTKLRSSVFNLARVIWPQIDEETADGSSAIEMQQALDSRLKQIQEEFEIEEVCRAVVSEDSVQVIEAKPVADDGSDEEIEMDEVKLEAPIAENENGDEMMSAAKIVRRYRKQSSKLLTSASKSLSTLWAKPSTAEDGDGGDDTEETEPKTESSSLEMTAKSQEFGFSAEFNSHLQLQALRRRQASASSSLTYTCSFEADSGVTGADSMVDLDSVLLATGRPPQRVDDLSVRKEETRHQRLAAAAHGTGTEQLSGSVDLEAKDKSKLAVLSMTATITDKVQNAAIELMALIIEEMLKFEKRIKAIAIENEMIPESVGLKEVQSASALPPALSCVHLLSAPKREWQWAAAVWLQLEKDRINEGLTRIENTAAPFELFQRHFAANAQTDALKMTNAMQSLLEMLNATYARITLIPNLTLRFQFCKQIVVQLLNIANDLFDNEFRKNTQYSENVSYACGVVSSGDCLLCLLQKWARGAVFFELNAIRDALYIEKIDSAAAGARLLSQMEVLRLTHLPTGILSKLKSSPPSRGLLDDFIAHLQRTKQVQIQTLSDLALRHFLEDIQPYLSRQIPWFFNSVSKTSALEKHRSMQATRGGNLDALAEESSSIEWSEEETEEQMKQKNAKGDTQPMEDPFETEMEDDTVEGGDDETKTETGAEKAEEFENVLNPHWREAVGNMQRFLAEAFDCLSLHLFATLKEAICVEIDSELFEHLTIGEHKFFKDSTSQLHFDALLLFAVFDADTFTESPYLRGATQMTESIRNMFPMTSALLAMLKMDAMDLVHLVKALGLKRIAETRGSEHSDGAPVVGRKAEELLKSYGLEDLDLSQIENIARKIAFDQ